MKYQLNPDAAFREVAGEVFVVTSDRALHQFTNATATTVFRTLRVGPATVGALATELGRHYEVDYNRALTDVSSFVATLVERDILAPISAPVGG